MLPHLIPLGGRINLLGLHSKDLCYVPGSIWYPSYTRPAGKHSTHSNMVIIITLVETKPSLIFSQFSNLSRQMERFSDPAEL